VSIDNGGPAFPVPDRDSGKGMSLRDYFAGQALQGWAAAGQVLVEMKEGGPFGNMANWAYQVADAMLAARGQS
jgi:hypothetical protein